MSVCPLQKPFEYTVYWAAQANVNDSKVATHFDPKTRFQTKASVTTRPTSLRKCVPGPGHPGW